MFAYIKGSLEVKSNNYVVIDVNGIGYKIFMPSTSIDKLGELGNIVKIHTYYYVREDNISLYGFYAEEELRMFELLLSVSGIGAKSANVILSCITPSEFALAVITNDISKLVKIQGVGPKSAQRIILELKDKMKTQEATNSNNTEEIKAAIKEDNKSTEAIEALKVLGYTAKEIKEVLEKMDTSSLQVEDIIKQALIKLSR